MSQYLPQINIKYEVRGEDTPTEPLKDHIVIGTPGILLDWALKYKIFDVKKIKLLVLDDADVMLCAQEQQDQFLELYRFASF